MSMQPDQRMISAVKSRLPISSSPAVGLVLGTGLGNWVQGLDTLYALPYTEIPGFPQSTVQSHAGRLLLARVGSTPVLILQGRFHMYEGYTAQEVCTGVRLLALLGVQTLILTNAAGAINPLFSTGSLMLITDHLNMTGHNPLTGPNRDDWGPRFPDMSRVYPQDLQEITLEAAQEAGLRLERGVYVGVQGPSLETPAETRAYRSLGGDAVGMSTVLEAITAKHMGLGLLGLSCLTNSNLPDCMQETSLKEIIAQAEHSGKAMEALLTRVIPLLSGGICCKSPS